MAHRSLHAFRQVPTKSLNQPTATTHSPTGVVPQGGPMSPVMPWSFNRLIPTLHEAGLESLVSRKQGQDANVFFPTHVLFETISSRGKGSCAEQASKDWYF